MGKWLEEHAQVVLVIGVLITMLVVLLIYKWDDIHKRRGIWGPVGTVLGWCLICVGLLGGMVPIIPGFPAGILGLILLGPEDPVVRFFWRHLHRIAQRMAENARPWLRPWGERLLRFEEKVAAKLCEPDQRRPWEP